MEKAKLVSMVEAVRQAKPNAAADLYNAFYKDLYFHIYKTVDDASLAEDLLQETFIDIFTKLDDLEEPAAFVTWSRQIAYSKCTAYFRKTHELLVDENEEGYSVFDTLEEEREEFIPDEALDKEDLKNTIQQIISDLPGEQRSAILLHYFDELSVKDIAQIQGVSEGTVKSRLNYGRKSIKQAVETYEKKNGIKLHCLGVIPLLLWLLKAQSASGSAPATVATFGSAVADVASGVEIATQMGSGAEIATPLVTKGVKAGAKATGKFLSKKLVAGAIAATVAVGGATTAVVLTQQEQEAQLPMVWSGCGEYYGFPHKIVELTAEEMDDEKIRGQLEISDWRDVIYVSDFTGTAAEKTDGKIFYDITLDIPLFSNVIETVDEVTIEYDEEKDRFVLDKGYEVTMDRHDGEEPEVLAENACWAGIGENEFHIGINKGDHHFEMNVSHMTEAEIRGNLTVSCADKVHHTTEFTGVGHIHNGVDIHYMLYFETPVQSIVDMESWHIIYNLRTNTFEQASLIDLYEVRMEQVSADASVPTE